MENADMLNRYTVTPCVEHGDRSLLISIVALGLVSAIAFSASYQLVARYANKSVIALGLGCVGSGIVVLLLEVAVRLHSSPSHGQLIWLFELTAGTLPSPAQPSPALPGRPVPCMRLLVPAGTDGKHC
jgi:hypothetical protein